MWSIKVFYLILITFLFRKHATLVNRDMKKPTEKLCYNTENGETLLGENRYFSEKKKTVSNSKNQNNNLSFGFWRN